MGACDDKPRGASATPAQMGVCGKGRVPARTWLREVVACWHGFVASLLPPLQLLCWLRPFIPHRGQEGWLVGLKDRLGDCYCAGLRPEQEEEKVMTWPELEERMREQSFRCLG